MRCLLLHGMLLGWAGCSMLAGAASAAAQAPAAKDDAKSAAAAAPAAEAAAAEPAKKITYDEHVRPIMREHCYACHNQTDAASDLAVDSYSAIMKGGASGAVVAAGDPDGSRLWMLVAHKEKPEMPPDQDRIEQAQVDLIKAWIGGGALEHSGSQAAAKPTQSLELKLDTSLGKPSGPAAMPEASKPTGPIVHTSRSGAITALASSPWAPLLAVASQKQVLLYHSESGDLLQVLPFAEGVPQVVRFSRNGEVLLVGGGRGGKSGSVVLFDVRSGRRIAEIGDELDAVLGADVSPDLKYVALGGPKRVVRLYRVADGELVAEMRKHTDWVYAVEFSPNGELLATADRAGGLFVWEADSGQEYLNLAGHRGGVTSVSWRIDSRVLASGSDDGTIKVWDAVGGRMLRSTNAHGPGVASLVFSQDGQLASVGRDRRVRLWNGEGRQTRQFDELAELGMRVAFTHDSAAVVAGDWAGNVRVWETASGKQLRTLAAHVPEAPADSSPAAADSKVETPADSED